MVDPTGSERWRGHVDRARAILSHRGFTWAHRIIVTVVLLWCARLFVQKVAPHYPVDKWLFWVYTRIWVWVAFFMIACFSSGHAVVSLVMPHGLTLRARACYSICAGVLVFFSGTFIAGLLGALGPRFAVAWPAVLAIGGVPSLLRRARKALPHIRAARHRASPPPWWFWPVAAYGVLALAAVYFAILTPQNIAFDSHFYHLGIAQQYAAEGAITRSPEGWFSATIPHLASVLYTWALVVPGFPNVDRVLLAGHMEFALFLATLASLPVLVRWLVPGARAGLSWVALFLFPGIFLYDSSLSTAADHIAAFWAPAIYLALGQAWRDLEPRRCAILAMVLGGALLTKYQGVQVAILPVLAISVRALWLAIRELRPRGRPRRYWFAVGPAVAVGVGLLVTAPHWLKNLVWYGDPLYPYLHHRFAPRPWSPDAAATFDRYWQEVQVGSWRPQGTQSSKIEETLWSLYKFSFEPHDWPKFHGTVPVFGSLFTLTTFVLPLLRRSKRLWGIYLGASLAVLQWYWSMHQDRYLQVVLPWMVAGVAGVFVLVWRMGILPRIGLLVLVGFQLVWGGDVYFIPGHSMINGTPVKAVSDLLAQGYKKKYDGRLVVAAEFEKVAAAVPRNARILNHEENRRLGLFRPVVSDFVPWQYGIRYGRMESAAALHDKLVEMGVTHVLFRTSKSRGYDTLAGDLRFFEYVTNHLVDTKRFGGRTLGQVPAERPEPAGNGVVYLGCNRYYERGLHDLGALNVPELWPARGQKRVAAASAYDDDPASLPNLLEDAQFAVIGTNCKPSLPQDALRGFVQVATRGKEQLYLRDEHRVDKNGGAVDNLPPPDEEDDPLMR